MYGPKAIVSAGSKEVRLLLLTHLPRVHAYLKAKAIQ